MGLVELGWRGPITLAVTWGQMEEIHIREAGATRRELGLVETRILAISMVFRSLGFNPKVLLGKLVDLATLEQEQEEIVEAASERSQLVEADDLGRSSWVVEAPKRLSEATQTIGVASE